MRAGGVLRSLFDRAIRHDRNQEENIPREWLVHRYQTYL